MKKSYIKPHVRISELSQCTMAVASNVNIKIGFDDNGNEKVITDPRDLG